MVNLVCTNFWETNFKIIVVKKNLGKQIFLTSQVNEILESNSYKNRLQINVRKVKLTFVGYRALETDFEGTNFR